ncbi:unnamed protein product [Mycena citricolor]|uniref:Uncharacterized protein n=1 Tax=Mycena citricolor TaxID=2018698 RepID=A0AAD2H6G4_9AGAR|nr:unnamed protein product [Mycena citricolor]
MPTPEENPSDKRSTRRLALNSPCGKFKSEPKRHRGPTRRPCSQSNERARKSSSGFEGCGICKNARLGQFL